MNPVPVLPNRLYDVLKYIAQILLPALGTLYFALADMWNLPKANEVVGTVIAVDAFLGVILRLSSAQYDASDEKFDGAINVEETEEKKVISLDVTGDPDEVLEKKDEMLFKVNKTSEEGTTELVPKKVAKKATKKAPKKS